MTHKRTCPTCCIEFEVTSVRSKKRFCSKLCCQTQYQCICEYCKSSFRAKVTTQRFCSKSCALSHRNKTITVIDFWKRRYGDKWQMRYDEWISTMSRISSGTNNRMYGRHDHTHGLKKFAEFRRGKSLEEIHDADTAASLRLSRSENSKGKNNPAYGKLYDNGGKSVKGYYKRLFFRSLFEYSFMKRLEFLGFDLHHDLDYECFVIPYSFEGRDRTYRADFYLKPTRELFEVKPWYATQKVSPINREKWFAAEAFATTNQMSYYVVTEFDFPKIGFQIAIQDNDVVWKTETFKYFKDTL